MAKQSSEITVELLQAFADAWNRPDVDALMSFMTDDCVFEESAGDEVCGVRYQGFKAVRAGFAKAREALPDAKWSNARHFICGESIGRITALSCLIEHLAMRFDAVGTHEIIRCPG